VPPDEVQSRIQGEHFERDRSPYPDANISTEFTRLVPRLGALRLPLFRLGLLVLYFGSLFVAIKTYSH